MDDLDKNSFGFPPDDWISKSNSDGDVPSQVSAANHLPFPAVMVLMSWLVIPLWLDPAAPLTIFGNCVMVEFEKSSMVSSELDEPIPISKLIFCVVLDSMSK